MGCITEEKTPPVTAPPEVKISAEVTPQELEAEIKLSVKALGYDDETATRVARTVALWEDDEEAPLVLGMRNKIADARLRHKEGSITIDDLAKTEYYTAIEMNRRIKAEVPEYAEDNWHLNSVIEDEGANCLGYTQMLFILDRAAGLSIEPIEVLESIDLKAAHVTGLITLSDGRNVVVELTSTAAYTSQEFTLEEEYREAGNYLELFDKESSKLPHRRIRRLDEGGLAAIIHISKGREYDTAGEYAKAVSESDMAIGLDPNNALAYNNRGTAYHDLGKFFKALSDYDRAIELDPNFADAYSNRGIVYDDMKEYTKAVSDYTTAIELSADLSVAYYNRGTAYDHLEEYSKAISDFDKAIELNPEYASAYYGRGDAYSDLGEHTKALSDYDKAIELNPGFSEAYTNRGVVYAKLGEYTKAISDYDKAIELNPLFAAIYYNRGNAYANLGEYAMAISDYTKAVELYPDFADAYNNRGNAYNMIGESQKAQSDFEAAAKLDPGYKR